MTNNDFSMTKESTQDGVRFYLAGRVNIYNAPMIQNEIESALKAGETKIILNMCQVYFLSSAGIRVILMMHKKATEANGSFGIEQPSDNVRNVLGMTALDEMLV